VHRSHRIVFQKLVGTEDAASGVRLDGYDVEWIVKSLFDGHLDARLIFVVICVVRGTQALLLEIGIRTGVKVVAVAVVVVIIIIEEPFAL
jgi:hypothetical protein